MLTTQDLELVFSIATVSLAILVPVVSFIYNRKKRLNAYFETIWKNSSKLKPKDILGIRASAKRGFRKYYFERPIDKDIRENLEKNENILVIGNPLAGKTRAIFQALKTLKEPFDVIVPKVGNVDLAEFRIPIHLNWRRKTLVLFDDLDKFVEEEHFLHILNMFDERKVTIIASCRSGPEYDNLRKKMKEEQLDLFFVRTLEIATISRDDAEKIGQETAEPIPPHFDGNIGSIFLHLHVMESRFRECNEVEKCFLKATKRLYYAGIYEERQIFGIALIKKVCKWKGIEKEEYEWDEVLEGLKKKGFFFEVDRNRIQVEETFLESVIEGEVQMLPNFYEMIEIFPDIPDALFDIGLEASHKGEFNLEKAKFQRVAIYANQQAILVYSLEKFPMDYAKTKNNLGNDYRTLAEVEDKASNCKNAINAYKQALLIRTLEKFPMDYARTQNNIGAAYQMLAEVEDKASNCKNAINACKQALLIRTLEKFPMQYAKTQNYLGAAYRLLAEVEDKASNCKNAIKAHEQALLVYSLEKFPMDYAGTKNNLGNDYGTLAGVEDKASNCKNAMKAYKQALIVYTEAKFPLQYRMVKHNIDLRKGQNGAFITCLL
jgi:tetratricopeptide (TPR) repeat protein